MCVTHPLLVLGVSLNPYLGLISYVAIDGMVKSWGTWNISAFNPQDMNVECDKNENAILNPQGWLRQDLTSKG